MVDARTHPRSTLMNAPTWPHTIAIALGTALVVILLAQVFLAAL